MPRWGVLGTGKMAATFVEAIRTSGTGDILAVAARSEQRAEMFAGERKLRRAYGGYEALLADVDVDVVYIAVPHPLHSHWVVRCAEAGKHVLCEKPLGLNYSEAKAAVDAARASGVFLMEGLMYRCHEQFSAVLDLVRQGSVGRVEVVEAQYTFLAARSNARLFRRELGGGSILDVGCYCVSAALAIAGAAGLGRGEVVSVRGKGVVNDEGVDEYALGVISFASGCIANVVSGVATTRSAWVKVHGDKGSLIVNEPWKPGARTTLALARAGEVTDIEVRGTDDDIYAKEAATVAAHLGHGEAPEMPLDDSLTYLSALDMWRQAIGVTYDSDVQGRGGDRGDQGTAAGG